MAMNEKFNKDEVWGDIGKSNKSHPKDKEGDEKISDDDDYQDDDDDAELLKVEVKLKSAITFCSFQSGLWLSKCLI